MSESIIYTLTDEAPLLATYALLPIIRAFAAPMGVDVKTRDISLASRLAAQLASKLPEGKRLPDDLAELGDSCAKDPKANIIKTPNISASIPQMEAAIKELQEAGYSLPDYPVDPKTDEEKTIKAAYDKAKGSAVNPVLREGNSDRRAPKAVKEYARQHPHSMGKWTKENKTHVATMTRGDFRNQELAVTATKPTKVRIEHHSEDGKVTVLKEKGIELDVGDVADATCMSKQALVDFLNVQVAHCRSMGDKVLFSLHLKATMMKVSDPIIFGHVVRCFHKTVWDDHGDFIEKELRINPNDGVGTVLKMLDSAPADRQARATLVANAIRTMAGTPHISYVDSDKGITNLHVPSDVIIDASMPAMIRSGGTMYGRDGESYETKAVIPDSSYAAVFQECIDFCKQNGAFDPKTMGSVDNVGLMAKKAEEYGSHDKTFEISQGKGSVKAVDIDTGDVIFEHKVEDGDIYRMCVVRTDAIDDWIKLAIRRSQLSGRDVVFWLDESRAHDQELIKKVRPELEKAGRTDVRILTPAQACRVSCQYIHEKKDIIGATGNVLRDYLTDLFPILEVGTSAKMLSIVPLMKGGGLFETGAGGSAPKHVQQFVQEGHLRWDSLGEYLALAASLEFLFETTGNKGAKILGHTLNEATEQVLLLNKSPSRKVNQIDNRGTTYYLARFWARALADQKEHAAAASGFKAVAEAFETQEKAINDELLAAQGKPVDIGGYYFPSVEKVTAAMNPSATLNAVISGIPKSL